jgi:hydroxyacylglutathione hydrolase
MPPEIDVITYSGVRCYLIKTVNSYVLIDTGFSKNRSDIERRLIHAGCQSGNLKLILITHGDLDHAGNAAYLRGKFEAKIAMHEGDSGMVERGDMLWNRRVKGFIKVIGKILGSLPSAGLHKADRFQPDFYIDDGWSLAEYGFEAKVIHLPGHSQGSIGILTANGDLFCGDLFINTKKPCFSDVYNYLETARSSVEKLKLLDVKRVYPGHGKSFSWKEYLRDYD